MTPTTTPELATVYFAQRDAARVAAEEALRRLKINLRGWASGRSAVDVQLAIELALVAHYGQLRKDGITPFVLHPLEVANLARAFSGLFGDLGNTVVAVAALHDTDEDTQYSSLYIASHIGTHVSEPVDALTKRKGETTEEYYARILALLVAVFVKACDRLHNLSTMAGVFTPEKAQAYADETREYVLPMLKRARRIYPAYEGPIQAMRYALKAAVAAYPEAP